MKIYFVGDFGSACLLFHMPQGDGRIGDADPEQPESDAAVTHYVWKFFTVKIQERRKIGRAHV